MKVRIQEAGAMGIVRCTEDDKALLVFQGEDVNLQDCEHYRWHAAPDLDEKRDDEEEDEKRDDEEEDEEGDDEQEWYEILRQNYIAEVSVEGAIFYLIPVKKAVKEG
jgi:hypothetical protein